MVGDHKRPKRNRIGARLIVPFVLIGLALVLLLLIGAQAILENLTSTNATEPPASTIVTGQPDTSVTMQPSSSVPETEPPVKKVSTATIGSTGDILLHKRVIKSGYDSATGTYNYESMFSYFAEYVSKMDYAVGNLEVTLCSDDNGYAYSGYP